MARVMVDSWSFWTLWMQGITRARPPTIMVGGLCIKPDIMRASLGPTTSTFMLKHILVRTYLLNSNRNSTEHKCFGRFFCQKKENNKTISNFENNKCFFFGFSNFFLLKVTQGKLSIFKSGPDTDGRTNSTNNRKNRKT
jgi:hypothetical protein